MRLPSVPNRGVIAYVQGREDLVVPSHPRFSAGGGHPSFGCNPEGQARLEIWDADGRSYKMSPRRKPTATAWALLLA